VKYFHVDLDVLLQTAIWSNAFGTQAARHSALCPLRELSIWHSGHLAFRMFGIPVLFSFGIQTVQHSAPYP